MLAQTAMSVVFVLAEKIRRGTDLFGNGGKNDYGFTMSEYS
jgi:NADH/NAD ratio-sensing transcriptional regulator Rex